MSYFKEVEFELPPDPGLPKPESKKVEFNKEKLEEVHKRILQEFEKIRTGTSEYTHYAIDTRNFSFPAGNQLKIFIANPTIKTLAGFIELAKQDLGLRAANAFADWLKETVNE